MSSQLPREVCCELSESIKALSEDSSIGRFRKHEISVAKVQFIFVVSLGFAAILFAIVMRLLHIF
jgi:hypothetical protein